MPISKTCLYFRYDSPSGPGTADQPEGYAMPDTPEALLIIFNHFLPAIRTIWCSDHCSIPAFAATIWSRAFFPTSSTKALIPISDFLVDYAKAFADEMSD